MQTAIFRATAAIALLILVGAVSYSAIDDLESAVVSQEQAVSEAAIWGTFHTYFGGETYGTKDALAGVAVIKPGEQIHPPHQHVEEEYLIVTQGHGTWSLNGKEFAAGPGDMLYAKPWDLHGIVNSGTEPMTFVVWKWNSKGVPVPQTETMTVYLRTAALGLATMLAISACESPPQGMTAADSLAVTAEVERAVWAFHAADTSRNAEGVIGLLWPEYYMLADGNRLESKDIAEGSRAFMASLRVFATEWTDLRITPLGRNAAVSSFLFRDSIVTKTGELIQARGPTTFVWQRRAGQWRVLFGDADHYPLKR